MKKVRIKSDEMYPMYLLEGAGDPKWFPEEIFEIEDKFYKEYDEIETRFREMQTKIEKLLKTKR